MTHLNSLGLSQYEEAVYKALIRLGRSDARKISADSNVPITAVYPNLKTLVKKGLVQKLESDVSLYEAKEPKIALGALLDLKKKSAEEEYLSAIEEINLLKRKETSIKEPVTMSTGKETSYKIFQEIAQKTQKSLFIMGWGFFKTTTDYNMLRMIKTLTDRKKDLRLITNHPDPMNNGMLAQIHKIGVSMRKQDIRNFSIVIRDGIETKITLKNPEIGPRVILHIEDPDLSGALHDYFLSRWKKAKKV